MCTYTYTVYRRLGALDQPGNSFVSFVRAREAVCRVRMDLKNDTHEFCLFPSAHDISSLFPLGDQVFPFP